MLKITQHSKKHKMAGMFSLNTSTRKNDFCMKMRECKSSVCSSCYAYTQTGRYKRLENVLVENSEILSTTDITPIYLPYTVFRFNSFGELINEKHLENLVKVVNANSHCTFTLWTKRLNIVSSVLDRIGKPTNMILIYSSPEKNVVADIDNKYIDKVFTVFSKKESAGVEINCAQSCMACRKCYDKNDSTRFINELLR